MKDNLRSSHSPEVSEGDLQRLLAGDLPTFHNVFARGIEFRLSWAKQTRSRKKRDTIIRAAAEGAVKAAKSGNLSFGDIATIVNESFRTILGPGTQNETLATGVVANAAMLERELRELPQVERDALTSYFFNGQSEKTVCSEAGLSLADFRSLRTQLRTAFTEIAKPMPVRAQEGEPRRPQRLRA